MACAIYERDEDALRTFISSTRRGETISGYQFKLSDSPSLSDLARSGEFRVLDNIQAAVQPTSEHSTWLLAQGYRSSFTAPMYPRGDFLGLIFFDSREPSTFTDLVQRDRVLFCNLINRTTSTELGAVRTVVASTQLAREFTRLRDEFIEHVYLFAPLHEVGKIGIPDHILLKPGRLDAAQRECMESHVQKGCEIAEKIIGDFELAQMPDSRVLMDIVGCHHEFLDGSGYPGQLRDDAMPLAARIVTVADMLDALTSHRPCKEAWSLAQATEELDARVRGGCPRQRAGVARHRQSLPGPRRGARVRRAA